MAPVLSGPEALQNALGDFQKELLRNTRMLFDQLRRVARKVPAQNLEDAMRMLQRRVVLIVGHLCRFAAAVFAVASSGLANVPLCPCSELCRSFF